MSCRADRALGWIALLACVLAAGCFRARRCGDVEICNYLDDDCDGQYDEDFRGPDGRYTVDGEHCGGCGVDCRLVYPTAALVECVDERGPPSPPTCALVSCGEGFHRSDDGGCAPDLVTLCRPCRDDRECAASGPDARCRDVDASTGLGRCFEPCDADGACPMGLACDATDRLCLPVDAGFCACGPDGFGQAFGCLVTSPLGIVCEGQRTCTIEGLGECATRAVEDCDGADDDCDGEADEDFVDAAGRYVAMPHCGGCNRPCAPPGPNMSAVCLPDDASPTRARCETACLEGFVDVDRIQANGCECARWDGSGPPPAAGGDGDCDGIPDDSTDFVFVTATGSDANAGTLAAPKRTVQAGIAAAAGTGKDVLVARGIYEGPVDLVAGVSVYGGYRADFRDRSLTLHPVVIAASAPGEPALRCEGIGVPTRLDGVTLEGRDATQPGRGATVAYFDGCTDAVVLADVEVFVARGSAGIRGTSSAERLAALGGGTLADLDGASGAAGLADPATATCRTLPGGGAGAMTCFGRNVSGGAGGASGCPPIACTNGSPCANAGCADFTVGGVCDFATVLALAVPNGPGLAGRGAAPGAGGEATYNAPTNRGVCNFCDDNPTLPRDGVAGVDGARGADGRRGPGCSDAILFDPTTGLARGGDGADAEAGTDGSGGGGGSAGSGYEVIGGTTGTCSDRPGGSGGGGGSGGCGAPSASGGMGGGASVGLVVRFGAVAAGPLLQRVRVFPVSGGAGGDGGVGAAGGTPGTGAPGGRPAFWCARSGGRGGDGGEGGASGGGGGGCGGGVFGVLVASEGRDAANYVARLSVPGGLEVEDTGRGGAAGVGGPSPGDAGGDGLAGERAAIRVLP